MRGAQLVRKLHLRAYRAQQFRRKTVPAVERGVSHRGERACVQPSSGKSSGKLVTEASKLQAAAAAAASAPTKSLLRSLGQPCQSMGVPVLVIRYVESASSQCALLCSCCAALIPLKLPPNCLKKERKKANASGVVRGHNCSLNQA